MAIATCPGCDEDIEIGSRVRLGQTIICNRCGARLEIIAVSPPELDWAFDESDDLEDDSDDLGFDEEEEEDEGFEDLDYEEDEE